MEPTSVESHDTRLTIDADGMPHRLTSSWTTSSDESGTLMDEYRAMGLYVRILAPSRGAQYPDETSHYIRVGIEDHTAVYDPWYEVLPNEDEAADLAITVQHGQLAGGGMEGSIGFIRSEGSSGELILDTKIDPRGDVVAAAAGDQTIFVYVRNCDGNCGHLDEPIDFCSVEAMIEPDAAYELTVDIHDDNRADCSISHAG